MDITDNFLRAAKCKVQRKDDALGAKEMKRSIFTQNAIEIMHNLDKIAAIRSDKRKQYLDPVRFLPSKASSLTDMEREEFEESILDSFKLCEQRIDELKTMRDHDANPQLTRVQNEMIMYLIERTKQGIASMKTDQRKRVKRPFFLSKKLLPEDVELDAKQLIQPKPAPQQPTLSSILGTTESKPQPVQVESTQNDIVFTEDEARQFKVENLQLHHHLHDEIDAARKVEKQVYDIQGMMQQFAQEVGGQTETLKVIAKEAESASDNVGHGNVSLKKAADYGEGFGFMIFCIYLGASCLLLFFHYY